MTSGADSNSMGNNSNDALANQNQKINLNLPEPNDKGKNRDGNRKQNKRIPQNKATKKVQKKHKCSVCLKSFVTSFNLNRHQRAHVDELQFDCLKCEQRFVDEKTKLIHEHSCNAHKFECYLCPYKCFDLFKLTRHFQRKHTGVHHLNRRLTRHSNQNN